MPLWGWGKYGPEPHGLSCTLAWGELREAGGLSFIFSNFAFMLVFPAIVIVTCYTCIACRLSCQHRRTEGCRRMSHQIRVVQRVVLVGDATMVQVKKQINYRVVFIGDAVLCHLVQCG